MSGSRHETIGFRAGLIVFLGLMSLSTNVLGVSPKRFLLSSTSWSDLGTGSMLCQANGQPVSISMAETQPDSNDAGFLIGTTDASPTSLIPASSVAHIWAKASGGNARSVVTCEAAGNSTLNPSVVSQAGSTGTDFSINASSIPAAGLSLLQTIAANPSRFSVEVQNQSAGLIQVVRDDGSGNNQTSILLASGGSNGAQGGGWSSMSFKGRLRIYGVSGAQVAAYQD